VTVSDFRDLCRESGFRIVDEAFVAMEADGSFHPVSLWPNLRAASALFVLENRPDQG
jgi:hypothetical protein